MHIYYVTCNQTKFDEAHLIWSENRDDSELLRAPLNLCEIQGTAKEIAIHKAKEAFSIQKKPVIVDDVSLYFPALRGLPGPYIRTFLEHLGDDGLYALISQFQDRSWTAICTLGYMGGEGVEPILFEGHLHGQLSEPKGNTLLHGNGWNRIAKIDGCNKTIAEMTLEEFAPYGFRKKPLSELKTFLRTQRK
jgi:inosine triphosphate pyrophosphatase